MLLQFNFKNFKSFKDDTTLDMSAAKITEFPEHLIKVGSETVLPVAAIFGANASGKSNALEAFRFMGNYVVNSLLYGGETSDKRKNIRHMIPTPFLFDTNSSTAVSFFEVYFIDENESSNKTYNYGFTLDKEGVVEEWLNSAPKSSPGKFKTIFYRNRIDNQLDLSGLRSKMSENIRISLEKETLIVSLGAKLRLPRLKSIREWFLNLNFINYGVPIENYVVSTLIPDGFDTDERVRKNVVKYLSAFDESIVDFVVTKLPSEDNDERFKIDTVHKMIGSDKYCLLPLNEESAGTLKMFSLYPMLQDTLESGSILCIDELNARLHPLLVRNFIITFLNPELNPYHAQLIFTSHDAWQLNGELLRRDEIWFTEKDIDGVSTLFSLADFVDEDGVKIRKDENYEKNYLLGKYGAIPTMKSLDMFGAYE